MEDAPKLKTVQITNPHYLGVIAPIIQDYVGKIDQPTLKYETFFSYLAQGVQGLAGPWEFWCVFEGDKPIAFADWFVRGLPHTGTVMLDNIYSWNRARIPMEMLIDKYVEFGKKHRCIYYDANLLNEAVYRVFRKAAYKRGYKLEKTEKIYVVGRKNE